MKGFLTTLLERPRVTLAIAALLALAGIAAFVTMPRLEDPEMSDRWAIVIAPYPGADPETIERTVVEPIEEELAQVVELKRVDSTARAGFAVITLELHDSNDTRQIDRIWDHVRESLDKAQRELPTDAETIELNRDISDPEAVVLAVTGGELDALSRAADELERSLLGMPNVARVVRIGDPGEQVTVELDPTVSARLGITPRMLAGVLASRHTTIPAGFVELDGRTASLRPDAEFRSVEDLERTPIPLQGGNAVALGDVAKVSLGQKTPADQRMRVDRRAAVGLGIVPKRPVDLVKFGEEVRAMVVQMQPKLAPFAIEEVAFQPDHVKARLTNLSGNLVQSVVIVGVLLMLMMGLRMGLVVSAVVPLVTLASVGVYAATGGVLHQMSIAALVIAIGMLVDNAVVVAEDVQSRLDAGATKIDAMRDAVVSLAAPLGSATGTTVAAFVPMLMADGPTAEFTIALPVVITLTLGMSYLFALFVTPVLAALLKPNPEAREHWMTRLGRGAGELAVGRKKSVLAGAALVVLASIATAPYLDRAFFPSGDRNQLIVELSLPEGASIDRIDALSLKLERALESRDEVLSVTSFIGRGSPHFYYNLWAWPKSPHRAELVVTTRDVSSVEDTQAWVRAFAREELPELSVAAKKLEQGPGMAAPIEVRVFGPDLERIARATEQVLREVSSVEGTADVRETLGTGVPALRIRVDDATAARLGISRTDVVLALLGETHGLEIGKLRGARDPVPVLVRSPLGRHLPPELLDSVGISLAQPMSDVPLSELAETETQWLPSAIRHRDRKRVTTVLAELEGDATFTSVMRELEPKLAALELPEGVSLEMGGEGEGSADASSALIMTLPFGLLMLIGFLLVEFNSFRRVGIVLTTIPLSAAGVIPGLWISGQPFGFMSLLGIFALAGVVVNNAIVLLDVADHARASGMSAEDAMREAVQRRTRPILLTSTTTVAGLLPLALSESTLWPPLAWAMISGLTASTLLTLLVVPAMYAILMRIRPRQAHVAA